MVKVLTWPYELLESYVRRDLVVLVAFTMWG